MKKTSIVLRFKDEDLVYGPKASGELREFQENYGGKLLDDIGNPYDSGYRDWTSFSLSMIDIYASKGSLIHFDLTHMLDIDGVLMGVGEYANRVTSDELRYIRDNWERLGNAVKFYRNGNEVIAPWLS